MPLFEFTCRVCGKTFETLVMGNRRPVCPSCGSDELDKLYSTFAAHGGEPSSGRAAASRFT